MACRREGISPFVLAQPGRPASSVSVTLHGHGFGSRGRLVMCMHAADHAALEHGDAIGARRAVREGASPGDAWGPSSPSEDGGDRQEHHDEAEAAGQDVLERDLH